ncbi:hypothetical protein NLM27_42005 [Bradyrhizobium sp. CCGB12]|uniref:hypothetical protein n=1 Tax=Bradyrhizobium sp. CCGB12 TaxID=2949632 RepID=UPI0020B1AB15|nr:hypothetical protein [Bradyrhizobium sp. CCGB12]MCP3395310.1 hypothetical protein [Bradyrhizobium sp. CCGB12]
MTRHHSFIWHARVLAIILGTIDASSLGALAQAPDPKDQKGYTSFVASLSSVTASASDLLLLERGAGRLALIRKSVTQQVLAAYTSSSSSKTIDLGQALELSGVLCGIRANSVVILDKFSQRDQSARFVVDHLQSVARANYLSSVATEIQSVSKSAAPGDILSALQALFASYQIKASNATLQPGAIDKIRARTLQRCQGDLKEFDRAYYGAEIAAQAAASDLVQPAAASGIPSLSFLGPIGVLIDTLLGIITPVAIEAATIVDESKREQAIKDFLAEPKNQTAIRNTGIELAKAASDYTFARRMALAGSFAEQLAVISAVKIDIGKVDACADPDKKVFSRSETGGPSTIFLRCHHAVWKEVQEQIGAALKTASDYDVIADAGDTSAGLNSFREITADFGAIIASPAKADEFWQHVTQLVSFAGSVATAVSQENREKIRKAIDALVKG